MEAEELESNSELPVLERPRTRADCEDGIRPCPFVSCRHHLYLDVSPRTGEIRLNFPGLEIEGMGESCSLDVADAGGVGLRQVGELMNISCARVQQIEERALWKLKRRGGWEWLPV